MWTPMNDTGAEQSRTNSHPWERGQTVFNQSTKKAYVSWRPKSVEYVGQGSGPSGRVDPGKGLSCEACKASAHWCILIREVPGYMIRCAWLQTLVPLARAVDIVGERSRASGWREGKAPEPQFLCRMWPEKRPSTEVIVHLVTTAPCFIGAHRH